MFITIKSLLGKTFVVEVDGAKDTVGDLYAKTAEIMNEEETSLRIIYCGKALDDKDAPLAPLKLQTICCLHVAIKKISIV